MKAYSMSQQNHSQPNGDSQENSGRSNELRDRKRYEGFEGMNYEQSRRPFETGSSGNSDRQNINNGSDNLQGEN